PHATSDIYTLSLHDALPISARSIRERPVSFASQSGRSMNRGDGSGRNRGLCRALDLMRLQPRQHVAAEAADLFEEHVVGQRAERSEEHTSELQSRENLVCRL